MISHPLFLKTSLTEGSINIKRIIIFSLQHVRNQDPKKYYCLANNLSDHTSFRKVWFCFNEYLKFNYDIPEKE